MPQTTAAVATHGGAMAKMMVESEQVKRYCVSQARQLAPATQARSSLLERIERTASCHENSFRVFH